MCVAVEAAAAREGRHALVVGGGLAGLTCARELRKAFTVCVVDAKEYFEFTPGIFRAYAEPAHWETLVFSYREALEVGLGVRFLWGEVTGIDGHRRCARVLPMFSSRGEEQPAAEEVIFFDFCVIACGCICSHPRATTAPLWTAALGAEAGRAGRRHDERFLEGRRRKILLEHQELVRLNDHQAKVLIVGAGAMGVEWACELRHFFPRLDITLIDFLPRCLGSLPREASEYCQEYMSQSGIQTRYGLRFDPSSETFWKKVGWPQGAEKTYILSGVMSTAQFMPGEVLSERGPGGGGWILVSRCLQVQTRDGQLFAGGCVFAAGDCCTFAPGDSAPLPKTGFPAEHQAYHAARNICKMDQAMFGWAPMNLLPTWSPCGAGFYSVSLGPRDGIWVGGTSRCADHFRVRGLLAAALKGLIEASKVAQKRGGCCCSEILWYLAHHWPSPFAWPASR